MSYDKCVFCNYDATHERIESSSTYAVDCSNCLHYTITELAIETLPLGFDQEKPLHGKRHIVAGCIREMNERKMKIETIDKNSINELLRSPLIPNTVMDKLDKVLQHIYRRTSSLYEPVEIDVVSPSIGYCLHEQELFNSYIALSDLGYIKTIGEGSNIVYISLEGIQYVENMNKRAIENDQVFVAMWFSDYMKEIFYKTIVPTVKQAGYSAVIIPMKEFNDDITDNIIAEIKRSRFVIADFTGNRGGVYFEAGYAMGLGLDIIWTCKTGDFQEHGIHFDINHYNFILWENEEELGKRLLSRIQATI